LVIAPRKQGGAGRRADRGGVEGVIADPRRRNTRKVRRVDRPTIGIRKAEANVIEKDNDDVGRILRQMALLDPPFHRRILKPRLRPAGRWGRRKG
jgi:hypothetical protein